MSIKLNKSLVSLNWLKCNLKDKNVIILDCTLPKVTDKSTVSNAKNQIKGAIFFDIKNTFSDKNAPFPNTVISPKEFEKKARELGINNESVIICYDDLGIYSASRVWWMFQLMGFKNSAVLDGGLPKWKTKNFPTEKPQIHLHKKGNFKANYQPHKLKFTNDVLAAIENQDILIVDARSRGRFLGIEPEPRNNVKSGHIPNSLSLPYSSVLENGILKSEKELKTIFTEIKGNKKELIFSCGTGITAAILALAAEIAGVKNCSVYDGSWTEWGLTENLPIET
jgi:thiosulfate/3-mercaptopyruvate sulfurtransferase